MVSAQPQLLQQQHQQLQPQGKLRTRRAKGIGAGTSTIVQIQDYSGREWHRKRDSNLEGETTADDAGKEEEEEENRATTGAKKQNDKHMYQNPNTGAEKRKKPPKPRPPDTLITWDAESSPADVLSPVSPYLERWKEAQSNDTDWLADVSFGPLDYVGHSGTYYSRYPMGVCQGDCQSDQDCQVGLYCHQRMRNQDIPFCTGGATLNSTMDFCTWDTDYPPPNPDPKPPIGVFSLKLYWEEGYKWQGEVLEREWCMITDYDGYPGSGECWYGDYIEECSFNQVYIGRCLDGDPRQWFTFQDLGSEYSKRKDVHEVLIKTIHDWCLYRHLSAIFLTPRCDPTDPHQRFFALSGSFTPNPDEADGHRFEIGQYSGYTHDNCLTTAHHPKSGEVIEFHICEHSRMVGDETSYWELKF